MKYLLDTNICIYIMNRRPLSVIRKFKQYDIDDIAISAITASELYFGAHKSKHKEKNLQRLFTFLIPFEILPYDESAVDVYGSIRAELSRKGALIGPLDLLIAAHAVSQNRILVTNNIQEFQRVPGLRVENWVT